MSPLRLIYLGLAVAGAALPMRHFMARVAENGWGTGPFPGALNANSAMSGLVWDLVIAALALTIWILAETRVRRNWTALVAIPVTFLIGVGCGLPLYLLLRTRPVG